MLNLRLAPGIGAATQDTRLRQCLLHDTTAPPPWVRPPKLLAHVGHMGARVLVCGRAFHIPTVEADA
jgi:hypothetical protein